MNVMSMASPSQVRSLLPFVFCQLKHSPEWPLFSSAFSFYLPTLRFLWLFITGHRSPHRLTSQSQCPHPKQVSSLLLSSLCFVQLKHSPECHPSSSAFSFHFTTLCFLHTVYCRPLVIVHVAGTWLFSRVSSAHDKDSSELSWASFVTPCFFRFFDGPCIPFLRSFDGPWFPLLDFWIRNKITVSNILNYLACSFVFK